MTKAELRAAYLKAREEFVLGGGTTEYALSLDTMLSNYFGLPLASPPDDEEE